ncbi:MAG: rane protein-like protein [Frankiales bacterium]|jgi:RsiW-degrading membrane proteinase PrsW (M82 family)|nr:rane protein-like protein [Frankiales bacterium]
MTTSLPLAGWYADPWQQSHLRWWDGTAWSAATQPLAPVPVAERLRVPARVLGPRNLSVFAVCGLVALVVVLLEVGPGAFGLAVLAALVLLPVYAWAALSLDRFHPEPTSALAYAFVAGATTVVLVALVLNGVLGAVVPGDVADAALVAPVVEEGGKASVLLLLYRRFRHQIGGPLDGIVYAAMVGLGFATVENVLYYGRAIADGSLPVVFVLRGVLSPFAHPVFTACTGIGLGLLAAGRTRGRLLAPGLGLLGAIALHGLWNGSTSFGGGGFLLVFFGLMVPVFFGLIVLARREARREKRTVAHHLWPEVQAGVLVEADVAALADVRARKRLMKAARALHPAAGAAARALAGSALELAMTRERLQRGAFSPRYGPPEQVLGELTDKVSRARWSLPPAPPAAPWAGIAGGLGVPLPVAWPR